MKKLILIAFALAALQLCSAQEYKIAIVGLVHSHVWGHLTTILKSKDVKLVGVAEPNPALQAEAVKAGVDKSVITGENYVQMLDRTKPDIVWAFVENNRHLEIVKACAPRKINVIFEKPLASTGADAREIQKIAKQTGIRIQTNYQMAWWPANYVAKKAAETELGQVYRSARHRRTWRPGIEGTSQPVLLRVADRSGEERRRRTDGFRLLQRAVVAVVSGQAGDSVCDRQSPSSGGVSQSGRQRRHAPPLQERRGHFRSELGPAAAAFRIWRCTG